jgi:hypothetical protein
MDKAHPRVRMPQQSRSVRWTWMSSRVRPPQTPERQHYHALSGPSPAFQSPCDTSGRSHRADALLIAIGLAGYDIAMEPRRRNRR